MLRASRSNTGTGDIIFEISDLRFEMQSMPDWEVNLNLKSEISGVGCNASWRENEMRIE